MYSLSECTKISVKWLASFAKTQWRFSDYPRRVRPNNVTDPSIAWMAQFLNWPGPIGLGATQAEAVVKLEAMFNDIRLAREKNGEALPRPGTKEPIRFAASDRVTVDIALLHDFLEGILGFKSGDPVFVSDESSIYDFSSDEEEIERYCGLVRARYGINVSDQEGLVIADILERISEARYVG